MVTIKNLLKKTPIKTPKPQNPVCQNIYIVYLLKMMRLGAVAAGIRKKSEGGLKKRRRSPSEEEMELVKK